MNGFKQLLIDHWMKIVVGIFMAGSMVGNFKDTGKIIKDTLAKAVEKVDILEKAQAVQIEINRTFEKKLDKIDDKLDRLLRR